MLSDMEEKMYLFGKNAIVKHWVGKLRIINRLPLILDALKYLWNALRGYHIAGTNHETTNR